MSRREDPTTSSSMHLGPNVVHFDDPVLCSYVGTSCRNLDC